VNRHLRLDFLPLFFAAIVRHADNFKLVGKLLLPKSSIKSPTLLASMLR